MNTTKHEDMTHYTTTQINSNFRIKVAGTDSEGHKINTLMGVWGLVNLIGDELFEKFIDRAFASTEDVTVCKLRRGLKVSFYVK